MLDAARVRPNIWTISWSRLRYTKRRRSDEGGCCVFSDRWFESWRWLWPWRMFDERKSFVSGQISIRLRNSFGYRLKFFRIVSNVIMFHRVKKREISWDFERIWNRDQFHFSRLRREKKRERDVHAKWIWIEKCSEGKQCLTGKT